MIFNCKKTSNLFILSTELLKQFPEWQSYVSKFIRVFFLWHYKFLFPVSYPFSLLFSLFFFFFLFFLLLVALDAIENIFVMNLLYFFFVFFCCRFVFHEFKLSILQLDENILMEIGICLLSFKANRNVCYASVKSSWIAIYQRFAILKFITCQTKRTVNEKHDSLIHSCWDRTETHRWFENYP